MRILSYWLLPVFSGLVWLGMLLGMLLNWIINTGRRQYPSMTPQEGQTIAYISDVGAAELKPLFIAGCVITSVFLDLGFLADRWLRHRGRLVPNTTVGERVLMGLTIVFAIVGTVGLICLSIFDTARFPVRHNIFLLLFILGYLLSAIFICWEYQRLGSKYREHRALAISFWIKLFFVIIEFFLACAFAGTTFTRHYNVAAILEWTVAFIFSLYIFSFAIDLWPAIHTKPRRMRYVKPSVREVEDARHDLPNHRRDPAYPMDRNPNNF